MEEETAQAYAPSMPEPNVQEMVRKDPFKVPETYIRNQEDRPLNKDESRLSAEIPVVDLLLLSKGDKEELNKLDQACKVWGFFQVINHGVEKVLQNMKDAAAAFFELPLEEKNKFSTSSNNRQGYGKACAVSKDQKLDWSDALLFRVYPIHDRRLECWPTTPEGFKEIIEAYSNGVRKVAEELLGSISIVMEMDKDALLHLHKQLAQSLRINYYPACCRPDEVLGLSPHSDLTTISLVMQEDDVAGLQIKHNGEWIFVQPIPNALVVNVGDVIEIWSNGKYKSIEHQAVPNQNKARISYATFISPDPDKEIEPLAHMVDGKPLYKKIRYGDYLSLLNRRLEGKAHIQKTKIEA